MISSPERCARAGRPAPLPRRRTPLPRGLGVLLLLVSMMGAVVPLSAQVPTPEAVLGHAVGADFELADWDEAIGYLRRLDEASDHMRLVDIGYTAMGRPWTVALISTPANLANLDRIREISQRLAHPEGLSDDEARALAREGKAIVHIDGGLHSTEVANAQHTLQLAYDLLSGVGTPDVDRILDEVVLMLWPSLNPDGLQIVADWYASNVGTPYEVAPLPTLYQMYVGHDNNRDAYMLNTAESRVINRIWREWEPQIIHVHHQSSPFPTRIWLPPFAEPVSPRAPPLIARTVNMIGMAMARALEENGQPGATHMDFFDAWYPGYVDYLPIFQNIAAYWTETALYRYATPHFYTVDDFPSYRRDLRAETLYSSPWQGGWWRLRDAVEYMLTSSKAVLDYAARYRESVLYNRYQAGRDQIARYAAEPPYAYLIPEDQRDPVAAAEMLRRLAASGVPVERLDRPVDYQGITFAEGTWVIPTAHEFGELARELLEVQHYPDLREFPEGPPSQPYDVAGWTLGTLMGVRVIEGRMPLPPALTEASIPVLGEPRTGPEAVGPIDERGWAPSIDAFNSEKARPDASPWDSPVDLGFDDHPVASGIRPPAGRIRGSGNALLLDPAQNNAYRALNAAWDSGARVRLAAGDGETPRWVVEGLSDSARRGLVERFALQAEAGGVRGTPVARPRVGLYRPWRVSMDEGWTRWVLERFGFAFSSLRNAELRAGDLGARYDVIVLPAESARALRDGHATGTVPPRYAGGIGDVGLRALEAFVRDGGRVVALNQSSDLLIEAFSLPVTNVLAGVGREEFFSSGSLLEVRPEPSAPLMAGLADRSAIFFDRGPAFDTTDDFEGEVLARYADHGSPLLSGYLLGEDRIHGKAAALRVDHGAGNIVLLGFRPQWRGQTFATFKVLFNALLAP